jgi:hypothetical protein
MKRLNEGGKKFLDIDFAQIFCEYWGLDDWVAFIILLLGLMYQQIHRTKFYKSI